MCCSKGRLPWPLRLFPARAGDSGLVAARQHAFANPARHGNGPFDDVLVALVGREDELPAHAPRERFRPVWRCCPVTRAVERDDRRLHLLRERFDLSREDDVAEPALVARAAMIERPDYRLPGLPR